MLFTFTFQDFRDRGGPIEDISIKMANMVTIANYLSHEHVFTLDDFRANGYCRKYNVGRYLSKNVRDYIYYGNVSDSEEGVILTIFFSSDKPARQNAISHLPIRESLTYFIHKGDDPELRDAVEEYLDSKG